MTDRNAAIETLLSADETVLGYTVDILARCKEWMCAGERLKEVIQVARAGEVDALTAVELCLSAITDCNFEEAAQEVETIRPTDAARL